jgi:hypothetical protein
MVLAGTCWRVQSVEARERQQVERIPQSAVELGKSTGQLLTVKQDVDVGCVGESHKLAARGAEFSNTACQGARIS